MAARLALRAAMLCFLLLSGPLSAATVQYIYDELGRLVAVVDPAGETTFYVYDEVGNIVSVSRQSTSQVSVVSFTPGQGQIGAEVTVYGTGFSANAAENAVSFNGTPATAISSTTTTIVTSVPVTATTGPISVTSPAGTASSAAAFVVFASQAPQIADFNPRIVVPSATFTITGSGFQPVPSDNQTTVNTSGSSVIEATTTSLVNRVPSATGGKVSVTTPQGSVTSIDDLYIVPPPDAAADVGATARFAVDTPGTALGLPESKIGLALFDASAGDSTLKLAVEGVSMPGGGTMTLYRPDGQTLLGPLAFGAAGTNVSLANRTRWRRSSLAGCVDENAASGPHVLGPGHDVLALAAAHCGPASAGGCVADSIVGGFSETVPTNDGRTRNFFCIRSNGATVGSVGYTAQPCPPGTAWNGVGETTGGACACPPDQTSDGVTCALPASGSYGVRLASLLAGAGTATVRALRDIGGTLPSGTPLDLTFTDPAQNASLTFAGAAGEFVGIDVSSVTLPAGGTISVLRPDGSQIANQVFAAGSGVAIRLPQLVQAGTYVVLVKPSAPGTGNVRLAVWRDVGGTLALDEPKDVTIAYRKQVSRMTFAGVQGQTRGLDLSDVIGLASGNVAVFRPDGSGLFSAGFTGPAGSGIRLPQLTQNGTYTVVVTPDGDAAGSFKLRLWQDVTDTLILDTPRPLTIAYRNQFAHFQFNCTDSPNRGIELSAVTLPSGGTLELRNPFGTVFLTSGFTTDGLSLDIPSLASPGTCTAVISPAASGIGNVTVRLFSR